MKESHFRTWIEIDKKALRHNVEQFLKMISPRTRFMAVVKSNAYGHGLTVVAKQLTNFRPQVPSPKIWFGVDSIVEAIRLRKEGIKNPVLVLGATLKERMGDAHRYDIALSISNFDALAALARQKAPLSFHIKIDTGMHRQGFLPPDTQRMVALLKRLHLVPSGVYTHFASAKDSAYPTYTFQQLRAFEDTVASLKKYGFKNLVCHAAASGATLLFPNTHLDMVRVGIGIYGYWPSEESRIKNRNPNIFLQPVLSWKTVVVETKEIPAESFVGYDLSEQVSRKTKIAVLPVGYWHGYDRGLSGTGAVLVRGRRRKILGRVSMDMVVVDATDAPHVRAGDEAVLIGSQGKETIGADELALKIGTSHYELLTRINPLIKRVLV